MTSTAPIRAPWDRNITKADGFCRYTKLPLFEHPAIDANGDTGQGRPSVFLWRSDGHCSRSRLMTQDEIAACANPSPEMVAANRKFQAWRASL
jgi:hypothetical protein